jgi:hypothetical protein
MTSATDIPITLTDTEQVALLGVLRTLLVGLQDPPPKLAKALVALADVAEGGSLIPRADVAEVTSLLERETVQAPVAAVRRDREGKHDEANLRRAEGATCESILRQLDDGFRMGA